MAESSGKAFGRYLRVLRERRGLSLDDVRSLSQTFPETLTKSYLSRCEHGHHKLALAKLIPLSRIYEVPAEAVLERMELDLELDRLGGPDTEGKTFEELSDAARCMSDRGYRWEAYAYARDALTRAASDPVQERYQSIEEQVSLATLNVGTMSGGLGRNRLALHESLHVLAAPSLTPTSRARVCDRIAAAYDRLRQRDLAERYADQAIATAMNNNDALGLAYMYSTRAHVALSKPDPHMAAEYFHKSFSLHRQHGNLDGAASALVSMAECHLDMTRLGTAHRFCAAALRMLKDDPLRRARAAALAVMGRIAEAEGHNAQATALWHEASTVAREYRDRILKFKIDLLLFRRAMTDGDTPSARAIHRRLRRLSPWMPAEMRELTEFRALGRQGTSPPPGTVAVGQRGEFPGCN